MNYSLEQKNISINLKRATFADVPVLLEIEKSIAGTNTYSAMLTEKEWQEELQKGHVYLIEKDGAVAGSISYEKKDNEHAYISGLAVRSKFQGQGLERSALIKILDELKDFKRIDLVTHPDGPGLSLYRSLGFVIESRKENYWGDGEPRLVLVLEKK